MKNNPIFEENRMSMTARATNINPRGYQFGFIYNELSNTKTIAHELCHGAYHLRHTFDEADYLAPEGTTDNLMDYAAANDRTFNHWQWQDIHQPKNVRFKWAQDEIESETIAMPTSDISIHNVTWTTMSEKIEGIFITPCHYPIYLQISENTKVAVMKNAEIGNVELPTQAIYGFEQNGKQYMAEIADNRFIGYFETNMTDKVQYIDNQTQTKVTKSGAYNVWSWNIDQNNFEKRQQIFSVNDHRERIFYNAETREVLIVTDVKDLRWFATSSDKEIKLSDVQDNWSSVQTLTEKELSDIRYNSLLKMLEISFDDFVDEVTAFVFDELTHNVFDDAAIITIGLLPLDSETQECLKDIWREEGTVALKTRVLANPKLMGNLASLMLSGDINGALNVTKEHLADLFVDGTPMINKMSNCIATYAQKLCPTVATLGEMQKQHIFHTDADQTVGILLYEFATGTGLVERTFSNIDQPCPFVNKYLSGRIEDEIREDFYKKIENENISYWNFCKKNIIEIDLELTPGNDFGISESIDRHLNSNMEQIYIGGSNATIYPTDLKSVIKVAVVNTTSKNSLFLHIANNEKRDALKAQGRKMSSIKQILEFTIIIDENIFK